MPVTGYTGRQSPFNYGCINAALKGWDRDNSWERRRDSSWADVTEGKSLSKQEWGQAIRHLETHKNKICRPCSTETSQRLWLEIPRSRSLRCQLNYLNCDTSGGTSGGDMQQQKITLRKVWSCHFVTIHRSACTLVQMQRWADAIFENNSVEIKLKFWECCFFTSLLNCDGNTASFTLEQWVKNGHRKLLVLWTSSYFN